MKKILILGGAGFLGQHIAGLLKRTNEVFCCDRRAPKFEKISKSIITDIYQNKLDIDFDTFIHLIDNKVPEADFETYEKRLADHLSLGRNKNLILMSSSVLYANPNSEYGKRKKILENFWRAFCSEKGMPLTILRLFNVFGPYQMPFVQGSLVANLMMNYLTGKPSEINDMKSERTFVFAGDVARVFADVIENDIYGSYDICGNNHKSIGELIGILEKEVIKDKIQIKELEKHENIHCPLGNRELILKIKETNFIEALKDTYTFYKKNKEQIDTDIKKKERK